MSWPEMRACIGAFFWIGDLKSLVACYTSMALWSSCILLVCHDSLNIIVLVIVRPSYILP